MPMQIAVVNQNVNTIRSISSEAESGSHGMRTAASVAAVPASTPYTIRRTIEPLRTAARLSEPEPELGAQALYLRPPATRGVIAHTKEDEVGLGVSIFLIAVGAILV